MTALARLLHAHPVRALLVAALVVGLAGFAGAGVADRLGPYGDDDPDSESYIATQQIERATGAQAEPGVIALVELDSAPASAATRAHLQRVERTIRATAPEVAATVSYADTRDPSLLSRDKRSTYVPVTFLPLPDDEIQDAAKRIEQRLEAVPGVTTGGWALGSAQVNDTVGEDLKKAEMLAFPILFLLSLLIFRSAVAALLPLFVGGLAIVTTFAVLRAADEFADISVFALNLTTGLGLGLAIDYSLFIVSRYREELGAGRNGLEAITRTMQTAGKTVLFSSLTVAAALAALLVFPQRFLYSMGVGGASVALIAAAVSLLVLPAVLVLLGHRVNSLAPRWLRRRAEQDARPLRRGRWYRLSRAVMRKPGRVALATGAVLILAGLPFTRIEFGTVDASVLPAGTSARVVQEALERDFPPDRTEPITLVMESPPASDPVREMVQTVSAMPGVADAGVRPAGESLALVEVVSRAESFDDASQQLVRDLRDLPSSVPVRVTGPAADYADLRTSLVDHLPLAAFLIALGTVVVLFVMTGSVVLPIKALLMNFLGLSATFGMLVLIFQDGRFEELLAYTSQGSIEMTMPILLFAVAFGLSTDYGVFLLARIKEARDAGAGERRSVAIGLERTGRIVTAAALLFTIAIGAFATSQIIFIKQNGVGTAIAVIIDATIIRALLVPALMALLGKWNWWAPRPLRWVYRRIGVAHA